MLEYEAVLRRGVEDLKRVTVWRSDGDPFKFADKWDLNRLKITDAANGYRYWDLGATDHTLTRLDEHAIGWESLDAFDDSQAGIHTRGRRIE